MSDSMIMDAIASFLVLPNRLVVPLVQGLHVAQLRSPLPRVKPEYEQTTDKIYEREYTYIHSHLSQHQRNTPSSHFFFLLGSGTHPPTGGTESSSRGQLCERGYGWLV